MGLEKSSNKISKNRWERKMPLWLCTFLKNRKILLPNFFFEGSRTLTSKPDKDNERKKIYKLISFT